MRAAAPIRAALLGAVLLTLAEPAGCAIRFSGENAVYYDRGHYWIELGLVSGAADYAAGEFDRRLFTISDTETGAEFDPSRVEIVSDAGGGRYIVLSSGKLKGKRCYEVSYSGTSGTWVSAPVCDPAGRDPVDPGGAAGFFRAHIAPAFSAYGGEYRWNRLSAGYDLTSSKGSSEIDIEPVFGSGPFSFVPFFTYDGTTYTGGTTERTVSRMKAGADAAVRGWAGPVRLSLEGGYAYLRESADHGEREASSARAAGTVRLDNLFDPFNRHLASVFKGIDVGAGYAWYDSTESGGGLDESAPLLLARITWTVIGSVQISYGIEAAGRSGGSWPAVQSARLRLLLRDALDRPAGRSYHPDLELAFDWGRRLPFYEREERLTLGFTFDLYPW